MRPKTFSTIDIVASIAAALLLLFLFLYPHARLEAMREELIPMCDEIIEAANGERFEEALALALRVKERFGQEERLMRLILDHEDVDNACDAIDSVLLMVRHRDATETIIECENIRGIIIYLAGIETFTLINLF